MSSTTEPIKESLKAAVAKIKEQMADYPPEPVVRTQPVQRVRPEPQLPEGAPKPPQILPPLARKK